MRVLIVEDHRLMAEGLCSLINERQDMDLVGVAYDGRAAVKLAEQLDPDVVLMDIGLPKLNGVEATRQISSQVRARDIKILALSMHCEKRYVESMIKAGASGYMVKDCLFDELSTAIDVVFSGKTYLCSKVAGSVLDNYFSDLKQDRPRQDARLTNREREVLQLIAEGRSTKEIAGDLNVSIKTVETHRRQIMNKLEINNVAELTKYALREGLTSL
jgi:DNA-binding NarL/FixJ family response regulator